LGGLFEKGGGLFNLEKTMVIGMKNSSTRRLEVMQLRITIKSELSGGK